MSHGGHDRLSRLDRGDALTDGAHDSGGLVPHDVGNVCEHPTLSVEGVTTLDADRFDIDEHATAPKGRLVHLCITEDVGSADLVVYGCFHLREASSCTKRGSDSPESYNCAVDFKKDDIVIYPQHGACRVKATKKLDPFGTGKKEEYLILVTVINEMELKVPVAKLGDVGVRPPVNADELEDLVAVLSKPDPRVPSNWSRRFKNHQEKLKSGDVYQVAEVVRNLAARNRDASLSAAERTMYDRARVNLISEIQPALKVTREEAEEFLNKALEKGVLKPAKAAKKPAVAVAAKKSSDDDED